TGRAWRRVERERVVGPVGARAGEADAAGSGAAVLEEAAVLDPPVAAGPVEVDDLTDLGRRLLGGEREVATPRGDLEVVAEPPDRGVVDDELQPHLVGHLERPSLDLVVGPQVVVAVGEG